MAKREKRNYSVYVIQAGHGPVKIGYARSVQSRLRDLQTGYWGELHISLTWDRLTKGEAMARERRLHDRFAEHRLNGEWFRNAVLELLGDDVLEQRAARFERVLQEAEPKHKPIAPHPTDSLIKQAVDVWDATHRGRLQ